jgi:hypothetical protein
MFEFGDLFKAGQKFWSDILSDPEKLADMQKQYWENAFKFFQQSQSVDQSQTQIHDKRF